MELRLDVPVVEEDVAAEEILGKWESEFFVAGDGVGTADGVVTGSIAWADATESESADGSKTAGVEAFIEGRIDGVPPFIEAAIEYDTPAKEVFGNGRVIVKAEYESVE